MKPVKSVLSSVHYIYNRKLHVVFRSFQHNIYNRKLHVVFTSFQHNIYNQKLHVVFTSFQRNIYNQPKATCCVQKFSTLYFKRVFTVDKTVLICKWNLLCFYLFRPAQKSASASTRNRHLRSHTLSAVYVHLQIAINFKF